MTELATAPETVADTPSPAPAEARIAEKDINALADKVSEAAKPKSESEIAEKEAADLKSLQSKAFRRAADKAGRDRDDGGKFARAEDENSKDAAKALKTEAPAEPKTPAKAEVKDQKPVEAAKTETPPAKPDASEVKQPQSWKADKKAVWDTLSPEAKAYVSEREEQAHQHISKLGQFAKSIEPVAKTLQGYRDVFEQKGLSYQEGVKQLLDAQRLLDRDPVSALQEIAKAYGVDLGKALSAPRDPQISQMKAQIDQLTQELKDAKEERVYRQHQETESKKQSINKVIDDFSKDKTDFAELEADIIANINILNQTNPELSLAERLQTAYERAQWANPQTRQALIDRKAKEVEAENLRKAKEAAEKARRATDINVTSAAESNGEVDLNSLQRAAYRKASNR